MKPTDALRNEHEDLLKMMRVVRTVSAHLLSGRRVVPADLDAIVGFLSTFADRCHHAKEETGLFPALDKAGVPSGSGLVAALLREHRQAQGLIERMAAAAQKYGPCGLDAGREFAAAAQEYADLLARHIETEDSGLFPLAEQALTGAKQFELNEVFDRIENEVIGAGRHEELHALLERLAVEYLK